MRAAAWVQRRQRLDLRAASGARASSQGRRGCRVPGRQGPVLLGRGRLPSGTATRRVSPPVYRHGQGPRRPQRRIERGGARRAPGHSAPGRAPAAAAAEEGPRPERELRARRESGRPHVTRAHPRPGHCGPARAPGRGRSSPQPLRFIRTTARVLAELRSSPLLRAGGRRGGGGAAPDPRPCRDSRPCGRRCALCRGRRRLRTGRSSTDLGRSRKPRARSQPAEPAALSAHRTGLRLPPRPAPSPPAEVEVTAAPAAPLLRASAPSSRAAPPPPPGQTQGRGEGHPGRRRISGGGRGSPRSRRWVGGARGQGRLPISSPTDARDPTPGIPALRDLCSFSRCPAAGTPLLVLNPRIACLLEQPSVLSPDSNKAAFYGYGAEAKVRVCQF